MCLLDVSLVLYGVRLIKAGWRTGVDRHERRDLSIFRIGMDVLQRCLGLAQPLPVPLLSLVDRPSVRWLVRSHVYQSRKLMARQPHAPRSSECALIPEQGRPDDAA